MSARVRVEPLGAWISDDGAPAVSIDRLTARARGIEGEAHALPEGSAELPVSAHLALGGGCARCGARDERDRPDEMQLDRVLDALSVLGAFEANVDGVREGASVRRAAHARGLVATLSVYAGAVLAASTPDASAGDRVSLTLRGAVLCDDEGAAIARLAQAGAQVQVRLRLSREAFDALPSTASALRDRGASALVLARVLPCAHASAGAYLSQRLDDVRGAGLLALIERIDASCAPAMALRVECALASLLYGVTDDDARVRRFARWGCEAGRHLLRVAPSGAVSRCAYDVDEGPSLAGDPAWAWHEGEALRALRAAAASLAAPCDRCPTREACRGGCKIAAGFTEDSSFEAFALEPDPECPRVRAHRAHAGATATGAA